MKIHIIRKKYDLDYVLGELFINDKLFCYTCEDALTSKKIFGQSCIDSGSYKVVISYSNKFKKDLPEILNVKNFEGVRIHGGNDTNDSYGCILIGKNIDWDHGRIWECGEVLKELIAKIRNNPTILTID